MSSGSRRGRSGGRHITAVIETTENIIGERRLRTLRDLAAKAVDAKTQQDACRIAAETLSENSSDSPFTALCSIVNAQSRLLFTTCIPADHALQSLLSGSGSNLSEKLMQAVESDQPLEVDLHSLPQYFLRSCGRCSARSDCATRSVRGIMVSCSGAPTINANFACRR